MNKHAKPCQKSWIYQVPQHRVTPDQLKVKHLYLTQLSEDLQLIMNYVAVGLSPVVVT